jgi:hypothetical protein
LVDNNSDEPALIPSPNSQPETDITQPAGESTYVLHLPDQVRSASSDVVNIWTAGTDTETLASVTVPVGCDVGAALAIKKTSGTATLPNTTVAAPAPPTSLASTGVPEWLADLGLGGVAALAAGTGLVFLTRRGGHA